MKNGIENKWEKSKSYILLETDLIFDSIFKFSRSLHILSFTGEDIQTYFNYSAAVTLKKICIHVEEGQTLLWVTAIIILIGLERNAFLV